MPLEYKLSDFFTNARLTKFFARINGCEDS